MLSKAHALLLYESDESRFFLLDTGSSNGTFVNNIRLSKSGSESELTELFTGDIVRFGSDVLDKSRNVTQKSVIMKITLVLPDGRDHCCRPSSSRLYRPSDSYEDLSIVTTNLQVKVGGNVTFAHSYFFLDCAVKGEVPGGQVVDVQIYLNKAL